MSRFYVSPRVIGNRMYRVHMNLWLAVQALRGFRTYIAPDDCNCPECENITKVPFRNRLNVPPFQWDDSDKAEWISDIDAYECHVLNNRSALQRNVKS